MPVLFLTITCNSQTEQMSDHAHTNALINTTSPYLLQHAHNPVNWEPWGKVALNRAKKEDKPIIVSIGYSSCHWCHVMEKESFEDTTVANLMNEHFINIKVDREERPDIDQIYMDAVQSMGLNGGWPLNVFLTPDQKPFYGGTYFPNEGWKRLLTNVAEGFKNNRLQIDESAGKFTANLKMGEKEKYKLEGVNHTLNKEAVAATYQRLAARFDKKDGGLDKAPKFPVPAVWQFLATYYQHTKEESALTHLKFTLDKIANGGIYDHVGGGFARYSVDREWHVPHFEKMLYDNGQLLSLYANGYKLTSDPWFKQVIMETVEWLEREMKDDSGGLYSALDADSEGEEGKFYVWTHEEVKAIAGEDLPLITDYYDVSKQGNWEEKNVLRKLKTDEEILKKHRLTVVKLTKKLKAFKEKALDERSKRIRPGLDSKIIAGWNGLTLSGLSEAYQATGEKNILALAKENASFIYDELLNNNRLNRFPGKNMEGFLEDYAAVIQGFTKYYETTFDWKYMEAARTLLTRANDAFFDEKENLYFFTSDDAEVLIARKKELFDNVIPSSNSLMTWNLIHVGTHFYDYELINKGKLILAQVNELIQQKPEYMSYWGALSLELSGAFAEVVIIGDDYMELGREMNTNFLPGKIITAAKTPLQTPLFEYKDTVGGKTTIYVCYDRSCKRPVYTVVDALAQME